MGNQKYPQIVHSVGHERILAIKDVKDTHRATFLTAQLHLRVMLTSRVWGEIETTVEIIGQRGGFKLLTIALCVQCCLAGVALDYAVLLWHAHYFILGGVRGRDEQQR